MRIEKRSCFNLTYSRCLTYFIICCTYIKSHFLILENLYQNVAQSSLNWTQEHPKSPLWLRTTHRALYTLWCVQMDASMFKHRVCTHILRFVSQHSLTVLKPPSGPHMWASAERPSVWQKVTLSWIWNQIAAKETTRDWETKQTNKSTSYLQQEGHSNT